MIGWLYSFVVGQFCKHRWKIIYEGYTKTKEGLIESKIYQLQCEHCGNLKEKVF